MDRNPVFFDRQQSRLVDKLAIEGGTPGIELMENAANGCAEVLMEHGAKNVFVFAGIGNNGGDGFASEEAEVEEGFLVFDTCC